MGTDWQSEHTCWHGSIIPIALNALGLTNSAGHEGRDNSLNLRPSLSDNLHSRMHGSVVLIYMSCNLSQRRLEATKQYYIKYQSQSICCHLCLNEPQMFISLLQMFCGCAYNISLMLPHSTAAAIDPYFFLNFVCR